MPWLTWLTNHWHNKQRQIDIDILWPSCKEIAETEGLSLDYAKATFASHAFNDHAWIVLGEDEIKRRIDALS